MKTIFWTIVALCAFIGLGLCAEHEVDGTITGLPDFEELAIRLLTPSYPDAPDVEKTKVFVGALPDEMPISLPMPEGSRILGSVVNGEQGIEVVLDVNRTPEQVLDFYRESMAADNWSEVGGGFGPAGGFAPDVDRITLCRGAWNPSVTVGAYELEAGLTDVRLNVNTNPDWSPCRQSETFEDSMKPLPKLVTPPDAEHLRDSLSGGGSTVASTATMETDMNSTALEEYYADQLKESNWTYIESGRCGEAAWSTWKFVDEGDLEWNGQFIALEVPGTEKTRFVLVQAVLADGEE